MLCTESNMKRKIVRTELHKLQAGQKCDTVYESCEKQLDHNTKYMKVSDLCPESPAGRIEQLQDPELLNFVSTLCFLTGLIEIGTPATDDVYCGTCCVQKVSRFSNKKCPCPECRDGQPKTEWGKVTLSTAWHVLEDPKDVKLGKVRLFYDSEDCPDQVQTIYGLERHSCDPGGDWSALVCVTHDLDLLTRLTSLLDNYWSLGPRLRDKYQHSDNNTVVVVSHPHGGPKRVSIGQGKVKSVAKDVREGQDWCYYSYDATTCSGSSGAPVYVLGRWNDGFGYWFGHGHNHSGVDDRHFNASTIGVDSTYGQLTKRYSTCELDLVVEPNSLEGGQAHICDVEESDGVIGLESVIPESPHVGNGHTEGANESSDYTHVHNSDTERDTDVGCVGTRYHVENRSAVTSCSTDRHNSVLNEDQVSITGSMELKERSETSCPTLTVEAASKDTLSSNLPLSPKHATITGSRNGESHLVERSPSNSHQVERSSSNSHLAERSSSNSHLAERSSSNSHLAERSSSDSHLAERSLSESSLRQQIIPSAGSFTYASEDVTGRHGKGHTSSKMINSHSPCFYRPAEIKGIDLSTFYRSHTESGGLESPAANQEERMNYVDTGQCSQRQDFVDTGQRSQKEDNADTRQRRQ